MIKYKKKTASIVVLIILLFNLTGCSPFGNQRSATAGVEKKLNLAVKYLAEKKFEKAVLAYNEVIKIDSKNVTAYKGLGLVYVLQKKPGAAVRALREGLKVLPNNEQLALAVAGVMLDEGRTDKAEAVYKQLLSKSGSSIPVCIAYSDYLIQQGETAKAIALLEKAAARNAEKYQLYSMLAELYIKNGEKENALTAIHKSVSTEPNQSSAYGQLANLYKDKWSELIALGDQYIQKDQVQIGVLYKITGLYQMNRYEELIAEYGNLNKYQRHNSYIGLLTAQAYGKLGNSRKEIELLRVIKLADIKDAGLLAEIANCYLDSGDKANARKLAMRGIAMDSSVVDNYTVMYKSYVDEDRRLAAAWGIRFLMASPISYADSFDQLTNSRLVDLGFQIQSKGESTSKEIIQKIVRDREILSKLYKIHPEWSKDALINSFVFLDIKNNVAYMGQCEKATNYKPIIERYYSPKITTKEQIPADVIENIKSTGDTIILNETCSLYLIIPKRGWAWPVVVQDNIPFEEHLVRAGYPIENITFVDYK